MLSNKICQLFNIKYPIIQGGMVWCSSWKLVAAVSNSGGLGLLGAGSMDAKLLEEQIRKTKKATKNPFGVNMPLIYSKIEDIIEIIINEKIKIVFTSAGNPKTWTKHLQGKGIRVAHVISNVKFAEKSIEAGVDAIVAEGFEAGGHNGREETTSMVLIPLVRKITSKPLIAAGGISCGRAMLAAIVLGADGVQIGSRFAASMESSAHENFKQEIINSKDGDTQLILKKLTPVRLLKNRFFYDIFEKEQFGANREELQKIIGKGRSKSGMLEGNIEQGELEIGQVSALINKVLPVQEIINSIINEYREQLKKSDAYKI